MEGRAIQDTERRIGELNRELEDIRAQRDRLIEGSTKWAEKRNSLNEKIRSLRSEAKSLREKRDALNSEVQRLKTLREGAWRRCREKIDQLRSLRTKIREARARRPGRTSESLKHEIETIEWKIQTVSLPLDEERALVERVKDLENQLQVYREIDGMRNEIAGLENDVKKLTEEMQGHREQIAETAGESQRLHERMIGRLEKAKELRAEADNVHKKHVENRERANVFHSGYVEITSQIRALQRLIQEREREERAKQEADLRKKLEEEALSKMRRGEKLTFEEFKILAEQGRI